MPEIQEAEQEGHQAARDGKSLSENPYSQAQGSGTRAKAIAWRRAYLQVRKEMEIRDQEMSEDIFFR